MSGLSPDSGSARDEIQIHEGRAGKVGGSGVGVTSVYRDTASSGALRAGLVTTLALPACRIETTLSVREGEWVPFEDGFHRVVRITPATEQMRGGVVFSKTAREGGEPRGTSADLFEGHTLRVVGPDRDHSYNLTVTAWEPDTSAPRRAKVEWIPARYVREDTDPKDIHDAELEQGTALKIGDCALSVTGLEGRSAEHLASIRFSVR